jgi:4-carboxymuconolactone decarboxylase
MSRIPRVNREDLSGDDLAIWDRLAASRSAGLHGPYGMLLHIPELADRVGQVEDFFRFQSTLLPTDREVIVLTGSREIGARYAWARHEAAARRAGLRPEVVETIRSQGPLDNLSHRERILVQVVHALMREHTIPKPLFDEALAELGQRNLIEAIVLAGHYNIIGVILTAFDVPEPSDTPTF